MTRLEEFQEIGGKRFRVITEIFDDGVPLTRVIAMGEENIPSLAVFDKTTGKFLGALETNRDHIEKMHEQMKDTHHCLKDFIHKVKRIGEYTYDGGDTLKHKHDRAKDVKLK